MSTDFLGDAAERFSLIGEIDRWVIRNALRELREVSPQDPPVGVSINLSDQAGEASSAAMSARAVLRMAAA